MIDAAAIEMTSPSPPITASAVASRIEPVAAIDEHMPGQFRQRLHRPRQCPERGAQDIVAIDPRRRSEGDRKRGRRADFSNSSSRRSGVSRLESSMPFGIRLGIRSHDRPPATTGPASGPRRPRPQPATGQMPRCDQRTLGGESSAARPRSRPWGAWLDRPLIFPESCRGWLRQASRATQPGTRRLFPSISNLTVPPFIGADPINPARAATGRRHIRMSSAFRDFPAF